MQRRYSVVKVEVSQTYEKGKPKPGGLSDLKLGTLDRNLKCETDGAGTQDSPGYFGHIELAKPMFHIGFVTNVVKVLRCVSFHSSKLLCGSVGLRMLHSMFKRTSCCTARPRHLRPEMHQVSNAAEYVEQESTAHVPRASHALIWWRHVLRVCMWPLSCR